jgi:hypothetical protein
MFTDSDLSDEPLHGADGLSFGDQVAASHDDLAADPHNDLSADPHDHLPADPHDHLPADHLGDGLPRYPGVGGGAVAAHGRAAPEGPDIVYTSADGTRTDLGAPTEDLDGDGVPESVAVRTDQGDVLILSDTDADGHPDQLIQVDAQTGGATWAVPDGHGGWDVVQTGHVAHDGTFVVDHPQQPVADPPTHVQPVHPGGPGSPTAHPGSPSAHPGDPGAHPGDVEVEVSGRSFDAGQATIDTDGDGVPDTVRVAGPGGSTLYYQDTNGDGVADRAWTTDVAGHLTADYTLDPGGNWVTVPGRTP